MYARVCVLCDVGRAVKISFVKDVCILRPVLILLSFGQALWAQDSEPSPGGGVLFTLLCSAFSVLPLCPNCGAVHLR